MPNATALPASAVPSSIHSSEFSAWARLGKQGSLYLDQGDRLYIKFSDGSHARISEPVKSALVLRERSIIASVKRSRTVIRWSITINALLGTGLITSLVM